MASATTHMSWAPVLFVTMEAMDFLAPRWRVALLGLVHTGLVEPLRGGGQHPRSQARKHATSC